VLAQDFVSAMVDGQQHSSMLIAALEKAILTFYDYDSLGQKMSLWPFY
jgi:hypothetical protein